MFTVKITKDNCNCEYMCPYCSTVLTWDGSFTCKSCGRQLYLYVNILDVDVLERLLYHLESIPVI
jgi:hypothetical protein